MNRIFLLFTLYSLSSFANVNPKSKGLLWGSLYGDTFGGPYEFQTHAYHPLIKKNKSLTEKEWRDLSSSVKLVDYKISRSDYGPWIDNAPKGTITDDSRHKIIFWEAYRSNQNLTRKSLAKSYVEFSKRNKQYNKWLGEYIRAAYFIIDPLSKLALPPERLWGGMETQAGQMIFLLMPVIYPSNPVDAYKNTYKINFVDNGSAKDYTSSIVAGLSHALSENATWESTKAAIINTDPYEYDKIPYVKRKVRESFSLAMSIAKEADGIALKAFSLLEKKLSAKTWWEADVAFTVAITFLEMAKKHPLAAFALARDFGHDTDSYAQTIGAFLGALYGESLFAQDEIYLIKKHIDEYYDSAFKVFE